MPTSGRHELSPHSTPPNQPRKRRRLRKQHTKNINPSSSSSRRPGRPPLLAREYIRYEKIRKRRAVFLRSRGRSSGWSRGGRARGFPEKSISSATVAAKKPSRGPGCYRGRGCYFRKRPRLWRKRLRLKSLHGLCASWLECVSEVGFVFCFGLLEEAL